MTLRKFRYIPDWGIIVLEHQWKTEAGPIAFVVMIIDKVNGCGFRNGYVVVNKKNALYRNEDLCGSIVINYMDMAGVEDVHTDPSFNDGKWFIGFSYMQTRYELNREIEKKYGMERLSATRNGGYPFYGVPEVSIEQAIADCEELAKKVVLHSVSVKQTQKRRKML
jgi:hypothetical protein